MCVSVCLHDRTKTAETTITKLGQGHRVIKCKNISGDRVAGVSLCSREHLHVVVIVCSLFQCLCYLFMLASWNACDQVEEYRGARDLDSLKEFVMLMKAKTAISDDSGSEGVPEYTVPKKYESPEKYESPYEEDDDDDDDDDAEELAQAVWY